MRDYVFEGVSDVDWKQSHPTGIENFPPYRRRVYEESINRWGKEGLWIEDKPFGKYAYSIPDHHSLHRSPQIHNLSDFWEVYRAVKAELDL